MNGEQERKKVEIQERQQNEFINFVIKDWAVEIATEQAVQLEFMQTSARDSGWRYAKAEEISELMKSAYPNCKVSFLG